MNTKYKFHVSIDGQPETLNYNRASRFGRFIYNTTGNRSQHSFPRPLHELIQAWQCFTTNGHTYIFTRVSQN